jgi:Protein of unknown function (DUF3237)
VPEGGGVNTEFGNVCTSIHPPIFSSNLFSLQLTCIPTVNQMTFETGAEKYRALENALFVGTGRVVIGEGGALTVEYQVSQVGG